jgi:hypothetical protein
MNELLKMGLLFLLNDTSQEVTNEEMQNAYGDFVEQVAALNQSETDYSVIFRTLNLTRIEFASLKTIYLYEQGGKCAKKCIYPKGNRIS